MVIPLGIQALVSAVRVSVDREELVDYLKTNKVYKYIPEESESRINIALWISVDPLLNFVVVFLYV